MKKKYLIILFIISQIFILIIVRHNITEQKNSILKNQKTIIETQYKTMYNSHNKLAKTVFTGFINNNKVLINAFNIRDRNKLYKLLKKDYLYLSSLNFKQVHFHLPDNKSFLRMHKPDKFGDDLSTVRYSVKYVNKNQTYINGLEIGKIIPGYRHVFPVFNNKNDYIGSVETSFSVYSFSEELKNIYKMHSHFLINKKIYKNKLFKESKNLYFKSIEHKDFLTLKQGTEHRNHKISNKLKELYKKEYKNIVEPLANSITTR